MTLYYKDLTNHALFLINTPNTALSANLNPTNNQLQTQMTLSLSLSNYGGNLNTHDKVMVVVDKSKIGALGNKG